MPADRPCPISAFLEALRQARINEHYAEHARALVALDAIIHRSGGGPAPSDYGVRLKAWFTAHAGGSDAHLRAVFAARV